MRKSFMAAICLAIATMLLIGCNTNGGSTANQTPAANQTAPTQTTANTAATPKIGVSIQSLENAYWAGVFGEADAIMKAKGWEATIVDCKNNAATQISQVENFITAGVDVIMVHAADPHSLEDVLKQARDAGIKVMCWDDSMTNTDINWVLDNTALGYAIGEAAAKFVNEHYSESDQVDIAIMNWPQVSILLERENGILAALNDISPNRFNVVASQPALDAATAQSHMETILQANPNVKVVCSIGAGGDIGANQSLMIAYNGNIPANVGVFSADASEQQLEAIVNGEATRVTIGMEGSNKRTAAAVVDLYEKLLNNHNFGGHDIVRPLLPIDINNAATYLAEFK